MIDLITVDEISTMPTH